MLVTSFGDPQIGIGAGGDPHARGILFGGLSFSGQEELGAGFGVDSDSLEQIMAVVDPDQSIDAGQIIEQLLAKPTGQTASDHNLATGARLLASQGFLDDFIGFLAGVGEKPTGINNNDIGLVVLGPEDMARLTQQG